MPTPTSTFLDIAAHYGNIDRNDSEAVQKWFMEELPTLPTDTLEEIMDALLERDGSREDKSPTKTYPKGVPIPSLSGSPPAAPPLLASTWKELLLRVMGRG